MRKIIFMSLICLISTVVWFNFAQGETLPKSIQEMVLKDIGFYESVEISCSLDSKLYDIVNLSEYYSGTLRAKGALFIEKILVPKGYLKAVVIETTEMTFVDHDVYIGGVRQTEWVNKPVKKHKFVATNKLIPYAKDLREWSGADNVNGAFASAEIVAAKHVLKAIDYTNKWKIQPEGLDVWSFTFTYFLEPVFPELPKLGPFSGKGTAILNPATGQWETQRGVWRGSFDSRVASSLGDGGGAEYTAWLEKQTAPSALPTKPSQPPDQIPTPAETVEVALNKLRNAPILSKKECKQYLNKETERIRSPSPSTDEIERMRYLIPESSKAFKNNEFQKAIELCKEILSIDPHSGAFMHLSACYLALNKPDEALSYTVHDAVRFPHPFYFMHIAEGVNAFLS